MVQNCFFCFVFFCNKVDHILRGLLCLFSFIIQLKNYQLINLLSASVVQPRYRYL